MDILKEIKDLKRVGSEVIFYGESRNYFPYLEGLYRELDGNASYITSDLGDPVLQIPNTFYLDKLFPFYMVTANCKVLVMTMTDLNLFHIRRSFRPVHYVYVFHSLVSTHMIYRQGAFDNYNSILCVGPHQVSEIRRREELYNLTPKKLVEVGYYRLEKLYEAYKKYTKDSDQITVLVAPTWGPSNLLNYCGEELLEVLLTRGYKVILRLHPETVKRRQFRSYDNVSLETSVVNMDSLVRADILITDWSGIGLKYALGTERPVIFIDTPPKVNNPKYKELGMEPIEMSLRNKIGTVVSLKDIRDIPGIIQGSLSNGTTWKNKLSKLRSEYVFNFGRASEVGAEYIRELL